MLYSFVMKFNFEMQQYYFVNGVASARESNLSDA